MELSIDKFIAAALLNLGTNFIFGEISFVSNSVTVVLPVLNIPMLFLLNALVGMYGLVWSQTVADSLTVLLSLYVYWRFRRSARYIQQFQ